MTWMELDIYQGKWEEERDVVVKTIVKTQENVPLHQQDADPFLRQLRGDLADRAAPLPGQTVARLFHARIARICACLDQAPFPTQTRLV